MGRSGMLNGRIGILRNCNRCHHSDYRITFTRVITTMIIIRFITNKRYNHHDHHGHNIHRWSAVFSQRSRGRGRGEREAWHLVEVSQNTRLSCQPLLLHTQQFGAHPQVLLFFLVLPSCLHIVCYCSITLTLVGFIQKIVYRILPTCLPLTIRILAGFRRDFPSGFSPQWDPPGHPWPWRPWRPWPRPGRPGRPGSWSGSWPGSWSRRSGRQLHLTL